MNNITQLPVKYPVSKRIGIAKLTTSAFAGEELVNLATRLLISLSINPQDAGALMDLSFIEQLKGNHEVGLEYQAMALEISQVYQSQTAKEGGLRLLALAAPIHMGGNLPIEFLLENSNIGITYLYVLPGMPLPDPLPEHDLAYIVAPGDTDFMRAFLQDIESRVANWPVPVFCQPQFIAGLERDELCETLKGIPGLVSPTTVRCCREDFQALGTGETQLSEMLSGYHLPVLVRPVGSHAGRDLVLLEHIDEVKNYLQQCPNEELFLTQFIDYRSQDGLFRKYRIAIVDGKPFASHMAISNQWAIWYLNAGMLESKEKRLEEQQFMESFDTKFAARHKDSLAALVERIGLEYFGIDCAETRDGKLIIFEGDNALLIHDMDPKQIFPYKSAQMQKIFTAFEKMLNRSFDMSISKLIRRSTLQAR